MAVLLHGILLTLNGFSWNLKREFFENDEKNQVSLKSDKNIGDFRLRTANIYENISLNPSQNNLCSTQKLYRKSKHTFYVQQLFFPKFVPFFI